MGGGWRGWAEGDGRGPRRVWPEVNVFSQFLLAATVSSVTGRRGDSKRKGGLHAAEVGKENAIKSSD